MLSTELRQGRSYRFEVIKTKSTRNYYQIKTDDGIEFSLLKFKFQKKLPIPDFIVCYVKSLYPTVLGQDISIFINDFYQEGNEYGFKIKSIKNDNDIVYELEDEHDLCFKLFNAPENLSVGSRIKCKVIKINGISVTLKYVGTLTAKLPIVFFDISQWLDALGIPSCHESFLRLLESIPEFNTCLIKYDNADPDWIFELIQTTANHITDWLIDCKGDRKKLSKTVRRMDLVRHMALLILEESDFLRNCNPDQRAMLQGRLSDNVELFDLYRQAASKIFDNTDEDFIESMFRHLKNAGYLYKPSKQFRIMMTILKLRPELINVRMGELFETLHNWELTNWQTDPFRGAFVQQLQIFIKENCRLINMLPANDLSDDNKAIIRMILAIAVQHILATDADEIDIAINRAMLYRYISYLNPDKTGVLLQKGADAILGIDIPVEFSWSDTEHPTLLIEKSSHPAPVPEEHINLVKKYSTSKASVCLRAGKIHIIAKNANPESMAIPNNLMDWLEPTISLNDEVRVQNLRKAKDLKIYENLWKEIARSIFGFENTPGNKIEKKRPYGGEEVRIMIDDIRILQTGPEKQRLQFHCTISDELYHGDGWMPCDAYHMISWLTSRDIPDNYDGSLKFAQSGDGTPLLFPATVIKKNDSLVFSMKSQIENALLDNIGPGDESICIVTHFDRHNDAWLCLSEKGCTFKVYRDEMSENLSIGRLVRVRYIEPDRSSTSSSMQFFIGELSDNQEEMPYSIKKSDCLTNIMQELGELPEDRNSESSNVVEVEEVMSREELLEIIYMFQRCACCETEYLKAFNYLGYASILAQLAESNILHNEITTHMELLKLLQDFGRNQTVDEDSLLCCKEKVKNNPMLERIFTRLMIVADIEENKNSDWLWNIRKNPRNDSEGYLASLVLSYNMLSPELEKPRKEIMKEITTLLNVNNINSTSKYYGDESQTVEFKSSLIYSTHGGSRPDVKTQLHEIVHIICGFMNARGGKLYIGVNDAGYENGLNDDLAYRKAHGRKATIDSMMVDLQNHLDRVMPMHASGKWEIESDPESKKGVIVVRVLPVEEPVEYEGVIYVRSSSTTKPRLDEQREEFIKNRKHNYELLMKIWGVGQDNDSKPTPASESTESRSDAAPESEPTPNKDIVSHVPDSAADNYEDDDEADQILKISTGRHRFNILHNYEQHYVEPKFYLYFKDDNSIMVSSHDSYFDYENECRLALAVKYKEQDEYLIMTYDDGNVVKMPIGSFSDYSDNESRQHRTSAKLCHVNIGNDSDYLLSVVKAQYGGLYYRIDSMSAINDAGSLADEGSPLCENPHSIIAQEIVSPDKLAFFDKDSVNKESRFYGIVLPVGDGTLTEQERIEKLINPVASFE